MKESKKGQTSNSATVQSSNQVSLVLFPGETFELNEALLGYNAFGFKNKKLVAKRCGVILFDKEKGKPLEEADEEIFWSVGKYYAPKLDDFVIGTITQKSGEFYKLDINSYTSGLLNSIDFEGATKKTKPNLNVGDLVFCRISKINKFDAPSLSCVSQLNNKNWASGESFFGPLKDGFVFKYDKHYAGELYRPDNYALNRLSDVCSYDIAIGHNGRYWINSTSSKDITNINEVIQASFTEGKEVLEKMIHKLFLHQKISSE